MVRGHVLTIMEVDKLWACWQGRSTSYLQLWGQSLLTEWLSCQKTLGWFEVPEDTASQWTEDTQFTDREHSCGATSVCTLAHDSL